MHLSAVPPPEANRPLWCGLHAIALTAALWLENLCRGSDGLDAFPFDHTISLLSFPPEAKYWSSNDHLRPHISCLWPWYLEMNWLFSLRSLLRIDLSFEPEDKMCELDQERAPTLPSWPSNVRTSFYVSVSNRLTIPVWVPVARYYPPSLDQATDATMSSVSA